jgi:membrane-associated protease RseP (regulator of RpoE activity)
MEPGIPTRPSDEIIVENLPDDELTPHYPQPSELGYKEYAICIILFLATAFTTWLIDGIWFSVGLLAILGSHEFGHYWAARKNNIRTSLPYFLPAPPFFLAGTFGAFIRIKEPIPDRRILMEIGAYGPVAGFIVAIPVLAIGLSLSSVSFDIGSFAGQISLGNSIAMIALCKLVLGVTEFTPGIMIGLHPLAFAGWFGLFFTALNLWPVGQLDGGHIIYALFPKYRLLMAKIFLFLLIPMGFLWPGWWVWAVMVFLVGFKHPPLPYEIIPLEKKHRTIGYWSIFIFLVTILPIPIEIA